VRALKPVWVNFNGVTHWWISQYLPVYAFMHALCASLGSGAVLNPLMASFSVIFIAAVARKLWPDNPGAPGLAALLLASSSQFLTTALSYYTMPAHLCLNLLWLLLYLRGTRVSRLILPLIGVLALGLHQPFMHALFVLPFLLRIVRDWSWREILYIASVYLLGCAGWLGWMAVFRPITPESVGLWEVPRFTWPHPQLFRWQVFGLIELLSWQNLAIGILALVALRRVTSMPPALRDMAWGLALPFVFHLFVRSDQGHGWGFRYCHGVLGNLVLLAVAGGLRIQNHLGNQLLRRMAWSTTLWAVVVILPLRAWQVERIVRPYADAMDYIEHSRGVDIVLVDPDSAYFAQTLVRNDPFLNNHPWVMFTNELTDDQVTELHRRYAMRRLSGADLASFGLIPSRSQ
jgi:hypothetical protein